MAVLLTDSEWAAVLQPKALAQPGAPMSAATFPGSTGDDSFLDTADDDTFDGDEGIDVVSYQSSDAAVSVDLGLGVANGHGADLLFSIEGILGSAFGDTLVGSDGDDVLGGGLGNDLIDGGAGGDTADYSRWRFDTQTAIAGVSVDLGSGQATGGAGNDTLSGIEHLVGTDFDDLLAGDAGANRLRGGAGDDRLLGNGGSDGLDGGDGNDSLLGGDGDDVIDGGAGGDWLQGDAGSDYLVGGDGDDTVDGGDGDDTIDYTAGNDLLDGGAGFDTLLFNGTFASVALNLANGVALVDGATVRIQGFENLLGASGASNQFSGDGSGNALTGGASNDTLTGLGGDDTLVGGGGDDRLDGGEGSDTAVFSGARADYQITAMAGGYSIRGDGGTVEIQGIEWLQFADARLAVPAVSPGTELTVQAFDWRNHLLLDQVQVDAPGTAGVGTGTDGTAKLTGLGSATVSASRAVPAAETAVTDAAVTLQDAIAILRLVVGLEVNGTGRPASPYQAHAADFDGNGAVGLSDAIGVLRHVVGLPAPNPQWLLFDATDPTVPQTSMLAPGQPPTLQIDGSAASVHLDLVAVLRGDVDGSFAGAPGAQDLDQLRPGYIGQLISGNGLDPSQFGVYAP